MLSGDGMSCELPARPGGCKKDRNGFRHKYKINVRNNYIVPSIANIQYQLWKLMQNKIWNCCAVRRAWDRLRAWREIRNECPELVAWCAVRGRAVGARVTRDAKRLQFSFKKLFKPRPYQSIVRDKTYILLKIVL